MSEKLQKPKTLGDCWNIYKKLGLIKPEMPLDASMFPNSERLVDIYNELIELRMQEERRD